MKSSQKCWQRLDHKNFSVNLRQGDPKNIWKSKKQSWKRDLSKDNDLIIHWLTFLSLIFIVCWRFNLIKYLYWIKFSLPFYCFDSKFYDGICQLLVFEELSWILAYAFPVVSCAVNVHPKIRFSWQLCCLFSNSHLLTLMEFVIRLYFEPTRIGNCVSQVQVFFSCRYSWRIENEGRTA